MTRAVFLDRDGTLIQQKHFLSNPDDVTLQAGAGPALNRLQTEGFRLFIVSNQSGVSRGYFTMVEVERVNQRVEKEFAGFGVHFENIYVAPEGPNEPSRGRKPSPQFLLDARDEFGLNLADSYLIGDKLSDLECGWNAGVKRCLLVRTGYGRQTERESNNQIGRAVVVDDVVGGVEWILSQLNKGKV